MTTTTAEYHRIRRANNGGKHLEQAKARRDRNHEIARNIKVEKGCADCGYNQHPDALDFDHKVWAEKFRPVNSLLCNGYSLDKIMVEIEKCDVRCANCHRISSIIQRGQSQKPAAIWMRNRKAEINATVQDIKTNIGCSDCGYNHKPEALDFDHLPEHPKTELVSKLVSRLRPLEEIMVEIEKCEVRCANCHRIKTAERRLANESNR